MIYVVVDTLDVGGQETQALMLAKLIAGHIDKDVTLLILNRSRAVDKPSTPDVFLQPFKIVYNYSQLSKFRKIRSLFHYFRSNAKEKSLLICYGRTSSIYGLLLKIFCPRLSLIACERSDFSLAYKPTSKILLYICYYFADYVFCNSIKSFYAVHQFKPTSTFYIPNICLPSRFNSTHNQLPLACVRQGYDSKRILFVGRLGLEKNIILLIKSFIKADIDGVSLRICGRIDQRLTNYSKAKLWKMLRSHSSIEYQGEVVNHDKIFSDVTYLVILSRFEGFPNVALEALSRGIPVLCIFSGDLPVLIQHMYNGFVSPSFNPRSVEALLLEAFALPFSEYLLMSRRAVQTIHRYHPRTMGALYKSLMQSLLD